MVPIGSDTQRRHAAAPLYPAPLYIERYPVTVVLRCGALGEPPLDARQVRLLQVRDLAEGQFPEEQKEEDDADDADGQRCSDQPLVH